MTQSDEDAAAIFLRQLINRNPAEVLVRLPLEQGGEQELTVGRLIEAVERRDATGRLVLSLVRLRAKVAGSLEDLPPDVVLGVLADLPKLRVVEEE